MTENELHELRELLQEWAYDRETEIHLPARVLELVGLTALAILELRLDADWHRKHQFSSHSNAEANVMEAKANFLEAELRLQELQRSASERSKVPSFDDEFEPS